MDTTLALAFVALGALLHATAFWAAMATRRAIILRRIEHGTPAERRAAKR